MSTISEAEYRERIAALERQCATLATQVDRMQPVVDAAIAARHGAGSDYALWNVTSQYEWQMAQLAKEQR